MSSISNALQKGYEKYYNTLVQVGYINKQAVNNIIVAQWIYDVLEGKYDCLVNDEQYSLLSKLYMCVEGSCLMPYQNYCRDITINKSPNNRYFRITETGTVDTENNNAENRNRLLEVSDNPRMV